MVSRKRTEGRETNIRSIFYSGFSYNLNGQLSQRLVVSVEHINHRVRVKRVSSSRNVNVKVKKYQVCCLLQSKIAKV